MAPLFPEWTNHVVRLCLGCGLFALVVTPCVLIAWVRTPYVTGEGDALDQPVQFDHRHHVGDDGIDCLFCHTDATKGPYAGVPPTETCMGCHDQIWNDSRLLEPVRRSYFSGEPIHWQRVHRLPDFVFFDHRAHVSHGVGCVTCHGRVDQMAMVYPVAPLTMQWCLDCHRHPDANLRPLGEITNLDWRPWPDAETVGHRVRTELHVDPPTHCTTCHR